jgi:hypothetical protein
MPKRNLWLSASLLVSFVVVTGCDPIDPNKEKADGAASDAAAEASADASADGGATSSISCYIASQFICDDYPSATATQLTDVPVACSSASGELKTPSACPQADFKGKCTRPEGPTVAGPYVERFYTGADVAYAQDFCVNTANGVWSTTF